MKMNLKDFLVSDGDVEFMPIASLGDVMLDDEELAAFPDELPIIALKNTVLFPNVVLPITASREKSVQALKAAADGSKLIGVLTQMDTDVDEPSSKDLYTVGTIARVVRQINMPDGNNAIFILGRARFKVKSFTSEEPFFKAKVTYLKEQEASTEKKFLAQVVTIKEMSDKIVTLSPNMPQEMGMMLQNIDNPAFLINYIGSNLDAATKLKQELLEENKLAKRADKLIKLLQSDLQIAELKNEITNKTHGELSKQQREYFLQQQMKSIREELEGDMCSGEVKSLSKRSEAKNWPEYAAKAFKEGIDKLEKMHPHAPDYPIQYNHLSLMLDLPWQDVTEDDYDLPKAKKVLDGDHYGMDKIKDRILEYLAVLKLKGDLKSPILCFVGPPGIGKTSLGQSIAKAINRKHIRLSLGGLHDESELRGHRKTYIGAMPGRIIQSIKKAGTSNPVMILDEIEKIGNGFRGDPSSALLEILDPEQNHTFYDNYLELEYDLSRVMFIATANSLNDIQPALRDRLEIIQLSGYSVEEKLEIAKKHLVPKQREAHGLTKYKVGIEPKALEYLIHRYTRESGVRELDRQLAGLMRHLAKRIMLEEAFPKKMNMEFIHSALGQPKYTYDMYTKENPAGVAVGLAWTYVGGDILFIEASLSKGKPGLTLTGNLGDVMKESATTALSYLRAHAEEIGVRQEDLENKAVHIHVPEGAIPKDGPSAGVTMLSALASAYTGRKIKPFLAMSGEITLRGQVLPVGGLKEKVLAAKRAGLKFIILCEQNRRDIEEIEQEYLKGLKFHYVDTMEEVLDYALEKE